MSLVEVLMIFLGYALGGLLVVSVGALIRKARKPKAPQQPPLPAGWADRHYAAAWGMPLEKWNRLHPEQQAHLRDTVAHTFRNAA